MYNTWLARLQRDEQIGAGIALFALAIVALTLTLKPDYKRAFLRYIVVPGFWASFAVLLVIAQPSLKPTFGVLLGSPAWYDEAFTALMSSLPLDRLLYATASYDVHPPTWYLIEWCVVRVLGNSPAALRCAPLAFSAVCVVLTVVLARLSGLSRRASLVTGAALCACPAFIYYSQEARMYTALTASVMLAVLGVTSDRPVAVGAGCLLAIMLHNMGWFYVVAVGAAWLVFNSACTRTLMARTVTLALPVAVWSAMWGPGAVSQMHRVSDAFWIQPRCYMVALLRMFWQGAPEFMNMHAMSLVSGVVTLAAREAWRGDRRLRLIGFCAAAPIVLMIIASELWRPVVLARALLPSLPLFTILVAHALSRLSHSRKLIGSVIIPFLVLGAGMTQKAGDGSPALIRALRENYRPGDVIYHTSLASYVTAQYALPGFEHVIPDGARSPATGIQDTGAMDVRRASVADLVNEISARGGRMLVVEVENPLTTAAEMTAAANARRAGGSTARLLYEHTETLLTVRVWVVDMSQTTKSGSGHVR